VCWITLGDTGKVLGLGGSKVAALACSPGLRDRLFAASSPFFFQLSQYDLAVIAAVLSDGRFSALGVSDQIGARHRYLREQVAQPLAVPPVDAGCFGLGLDDVSFAVLLKDRYRVLTVPVSWFPTGQAAPETRVRVALARPCPVIRRLAEALNEVAATARTPEPTP
jgi:aspartate/methionine/tyrosine aminotransferase